MRMPRIFSSGFGKWWTPGSIPAGKEGDVIKFRFDETLWTMRVDELVPQKKVAFTCIEAFHTFPGAPEAILNEWEGTKLVWSIHEDGEGTRISFVHEGLVPALNCYGICERGWDHFFAGNLAAFLDGGE